MTGYNALPSFGGNVPTTLVDRQFALYNANQAHHEEQAAARKAEWEKAQALSGGLALFGEGVSIPEQRQPLDLEEWGSTGSAGEVFVYSRP